MSINMLATAEDTTISFVNTDTFVSGTTKLARRLHIQDLDIDFTLTKIEVECKAATGVSGASPGIIRV